MREVLPPDRSSPRLQSPCYVYGEGIGVWVQRRDILGCEKGQGVHCSTTSPLTRPEVTGVGEECGVGSPGSRRRHKIPGYVSK